MRGSILPLKCGDDSFFAYLLVNVTEMNLLEGEIVKNCPLKMLHAFAFIPVTSTSPPINK